MKRECEKKELEETGEEEHAPKVKNRKKRTTYSLTLHSAIKEDHGEQLYSVAFSPFTAPWRNSFFATVGGNTITVYECSKEKTKPVLVYKDADEEEGFYTAAWGKSKGDPLLAVGGMRGTIRIINFNTGHVFRHFIGHGSSINELKFHPNNHELLTSASKDRTLITWNIISEVQVYNHGGLYGHQDEVLSCDWNREGNLCASSGMDHSVIIWDISGRLAKVALEASNVYEGSTSRRPFPTVRLTPVFITKEVHSNYIDCIRWYESFIISKSCESEIKIWEPDLTQPTEINPSPPILCAMSYPVPQCPNWYVRFGIDRQKRFMAIGNQVGKITLWDLDTISKEPNITVHHPKIFSQCRQVAFSPDSGILVAVFDDTTVWRYTLKAPEEAVQKVSENSTKTDSDESTQ